MTLTDFKLLERIFCAEIEDRLPAQLKSKHLPRLEAEGLIQPCERTFGGRFPVTCKGWALTLRGNMAYCHECAKRYPDKEERMREAARPGRE